MQENADQRALRLWIAAGLAIPEVAALHGDAGYLLNNMIAKYTLAADRYRLSAGALARLRADAVDLANVWKRSKFYGKSSPYMYEHAVPAGIVREALLASDCTPGAVSRLLLDAGEVVMVLRDEDALLRAGGLARSMPEGWAMGDDPMARYVAAGIELSTQHLLVAGAIKR